MLEICVGNIESAIAAVGAGADRLELNSALQLGGLTPSTATVREALENVAVPVVVMIRPREGNFRYSDREFRTMLREAEDMLALGADGIAFGVLDGDSRIDRDRVKEMIGIAGARETVFHRAFDTTANPIGNMMILQELGITRILTSGCSPTAWDGRETLRGMMSHPGREIGILPAAGIRPSNVKDILEFLGCKGLHASCSRMIMPVDISGSSIRFNASGLPENAHIGVDVEQIREMKRIAGNQAL